MPTVASLHVYPLKGAAGFSPESWPVEERGLRHDRRFMLVDDSGKFISQRGCRQLALVRATIGDATLRISCPLGDVAIPLPVSGSAARTRIPVTVWDDTFESVPVSPDADALLSDFLAQSCRLVWMPDDADRFTPEHRAAPRRRVSLADAAPVLLVTEAALADLNERLETNGDASVPLNRFRANIVVRGADVGDDDEWTSITIGAAQLRVPNACGRCQVITIDQSTAEPRGPEPLRTLATYRREGDQITFGQHVLVDTAGTIGVGDDVEITARQRPREARSRSAP
ncbi:MAG: MOSC domain-containing protein [Phycisphaerae bacterium]|nr:MOSC domain-containing protein [Phycisphaerae bacterium]